MPTHKHNWVWLIPKSSDLNNLSREQRIDYWLDAKSLLNVTYCPTCKKTGHPIKSRRGGIRAHIDSVNILQRATNLTLKYGFKLPE